MNVVWLTAFNMPKKERYFKEKQEKIAAAAKDLPFNFPCYKTGFVNIDLSL